MIKLFLDANILLDFFRFGADDLVEVRKLLTLIDDDEVVLYSNSLLKDEVARSRESEIAASLEVIKSQKFGLKPPVYCNELDELEELFAALKNANQRHQELITALQGRIDSKSLEADQLIADLFEKSTDIEISHELIEKAQIRQMMNNPPRKLKDSMGDSLHWETLLSISHGYNFHIVSGDGDFTSELAPSKLKDFLRNEWIERHGKYSPMELHKSLGDFFRSKFPDIKLSEEEEKIH